MNNQLEVKVGLKLEPYSYRVELNKIKELAIAIGDERLEYMSGECVPPTFPTVIDFWGTSGIGLGTLLGLNISKVLHGEQAYEYKGKIQIGDTITVSGEVVDYYFKANMKFIVIKKEYINQFGELILVSRSTIIERQ
ncbi:FAS1-like dehydratase domain-containing protein [Gottfriedia acidiceleris]|uniref:FAS1-like dehydratase domain-containing protein n=1 Tax=Gottfriedia acidiceleris TaxID=371036 RepID=UPI003D1E6536